MQEVSALQITSPAVARMFQALDPTLYELDYHDDLHESWILFNYPTAGQYVIIPNDMPDVESLEPALTLRTYLLHMQ